MKVLVSGAGIAGLSTAFWFTKLGHDVTVVERFSALRTAGLQVDLRGHGIEVLKRMGLDDIFRKYSVPEEGLQVVDKNGKRCAFFPANKSGDGKQSFSSDYEIMRGDLCRIIYDTVKDKARFLFGTSIESFTQDENAVTVNFADGKSDTFDLLIGADGQHSKTRKLMLNSEVDNTFRPLSDVIAYFTVPRPATKDEGYVCSLYAAPKKVGMMTRRSNLKELQVYLGCKADAGRLSTVARGDVAEQKAAVAEIVKGCGWIIDEILPFMPDAQNFYCERIGLVKMDSWSKGRVVLVGDAAYCPSVNTGMGTTCSIVGAYSLAGEVSRVCSKGSPNGNVSQEDIGKALASYEKKFRPFMDQVQDGVEDENRFVPSSTIGIRIFNLVMGAMAFFRINVAALFLKEGVKNWDLPVYQDMERH